MEKDFNSRLPLVETNGKEISGMLLCFICGLEVREYMNEYFLCVSLCIPCLRGYSLVFTPANP